MMKTRSQLILLFFIVGIGVCRAALEPAPTTYVEDRAGVMDSTTKQQLIGLLQELEQKTTARVVVVTVETTGGIPIQQYSFERADKWKFGANQKGASALVVVAVKDREYFTQVGYNLEGVLPDSLTGSIGREYFVPYFKAGQYGKGIWVGVSVMAQTIAKEKGVTLSGMPKLRTSRTQSHQVNSVASPCCAILGFILVIWVVAKLARQSPWVLVAWLMAEMLSSGGRGGSSWGGRGGGFGGGGFGGFGGGGGGGFGGGGAGGKW
jgi:uncharacterized protein